WTLMAKATAVNFSGADFVRCGLYDLTHNITLDGSTYQVGAGIASAGPITNVATIVVPAATTVQVQQQCGHDAAAGDSAYLDPDASLVALETLDGTTAGQSIARTSAATPLTTTDTTVLSLSLPAGDYAVGFKFTGVTFSGSTLVTCALTEPRGFFGAGLVNVGSATAAATDAYFTYLSGGGTVSLACRVTSGSGAYLDPATVLWARKSTASTAVEGGCGAYLINAKTDLVALVRGGTQCVIKGGQSTRLSAAYVPRGTWVAIGGEAEIGNATATADFVRCEILGNGGHLDGAATWETGNGYVGLSLLGTLKLKAPATFSETCTRDITGELSNSYEGSMVLIKV
ncbi:MAG TPA: hypothetical protein VIK61_01050, partial [Acidimicrobiia bacterium]